MLYVKSLFAQRHRVWKIYRGPGFLAVVKEKQPAAQRGGGEKGVGIEQTFTTARKPGPL